jgi:hypothetical protein
LESRVPVKIKVLTTPFSLIAIAMAKHVLAHYRIAAGERLKILEFLDGCVDFNLTAEAIVAVAPVSLPFLEIVMEAGKLDPRLRHRGRPEGL